MYDYLPPGYLEHFHTLSVSSPYYPVLLLYVKGSMIKIEPSTFYKEYHLGLEDNITSLPAKIVYFLNAFNQVKNPNVKRSSIDSWKVTWIVRQNGHALLALPRTEKTRSKNLNSLHISFSVWKEDWRWLLPNVSERTRDNSCESSSKIFEDNKPNILIDIIKPQLTKDKTAHTLRQKQV